MACCAAMPPSCLTMVVWSIPARGHASPLTLRAALVRKFAITAATLSRPVTEYPELAADLATGIAEVFIGQARAEERQRCAALLRETGRRAGGSVVRGCGR